jgi:hypothetical protein
VKAALGALVLVLVTACSGDGGTPSGEAGPEPSAGAPSQPSETSPSEPPLPPKPRLRAAQQVLTRAAGGAYTLRIDDDAAGPSIVERGLFDVQAGVVNLRRTVRFTAGGAERRQSLRIRSSSRARFLQMEDWGPWDGCWGELTPDVLAEVGIDVDLRGFPNIPIPVSLVLGARVSPLNVSPTSGPYEGNATVLTDGFTALQMLGVPGSVLFDLPFAVARVKVPAYVTYFDDHPHVVESVEVDGDDVEEAFRDSRASTPEKLRDLVNWRSAVATFAPADGPVRFARPPARQLLPPGATVDDTCAAHDGPAQNITVENVEVSRKPTRV